jgi:hypothetical protein
MPAFRAFDIVSSLPNHRSPGANWRKSPAQPAIIPVFQRLQAETGSITTTARTSQSNRLPPPAQGRAVLGDVRPLLPLEDRSRTDKCSNKS